MRTGHQNDSRPGPLQQRGDIQHVFGFESEVELFENRFGEELHLYRRIGERRDRNTSNQQWSNPRHGADVAAHELRHPRALHLTTTSSPLRSFAAWTCAIEAEATHSRSKAANTSSRGRPRSSSTTWRTSSKGSGLTLSRSIFKLENHLVREQALP